MTDSRHARQRHAFMAVSHAVASVLSLVLTVLTAWDRDIFAVFLAAQTVAISALTVIWFQRWRADV